MTARRLDGWTWTGIAVTATAAAAASAGAQHELAVAAGWGQVTGWLLPGCVDMLAAVAARVWLDATASDPARRYARTVALCAVAVSLALNAAGHAISANLVAVSVPLVVAVGAVPAASLAATVHLAAVRTAPVAPRRRHRTTDHRNATGTATVADSGATRTATPNPPPSSATTPPSTATGGATVTPMVRGDTATDRARHHWDQQRAQGRTPTGAELARVAGCSPSMGRKLASEFRTTDTQTREQEVGGR